MLPPYPMLTTKIWRSTFGRVQSKSAPGPGWKRADLAACVLKIRAKTLRWCRWSLAGVGLASLLVACTPAGPRALLNGERLIRDGKYAQAITRLETATKLLPGNAQAFNHLGLAYHKAGQPAAALKAYEQARRCDPNLTSVHFNLG